MEWYVKSETDTLSLGAIIAEEYHLSLNSLHLHRNMIGYVYFGASTNQKYVGKLFRPFHQAQAFQSLKIIRYLSQHRYPVAPIIPTSDDKLYISLKIGQEMHIFALFEYIEGSEPDVKREIEIIGKQIRWLHDLMENYPGSILHRSKSFYIDRFLEILHKEKYPLACIQELTEYGDELWSKLQRLPRGFCHGDLHSGNLFRTLEGRYVLIDFDAAAYSYPIIDVATLCDGSNFNTLEKPAVTNTMNLIDRFALGYNKNLSTQEVEGVFSFIAIRHYELIATITECQGRQTLSRGFLDQQYTWLLTWKRLCEQLIPR